MSASHVAVIPTIGAIGIDEITDSAQSLAAAGFTVRIVSNAEMATKSLAARGAPFVTSRVNAGFGASVRSGLDGLDWDWAYVINDDVRLDRTAAGAIFERLNALDGRTHPRIVYVGDKSARLIPGLLDAFLNISLAGKILNISSRRAQRAPSRATYASFDSVAISRSAWEAVGGFDPDLIFTFEDADFVRRSRDVPGMESEHFQHAGIAKRHSVSSVKHAARVLAVSVWSARVYLVKGGYARKTVERCLRSALAVRLLLGMASSAGPKGNLLAVQNAWRALGCAEPPKLPEYNTL